MIERVVVSQNPVTLYGDGQVAEYAYAPEGDRGGFSSCEFENRRLGGFWQAKAVIHDPPSDMQVAFRTWLGRDTKLMGSRSTAFHGYVGGMRYHNGSGGSRYISLDQMGNAVWVRYKNAASADAFERTPTESNAGSIARFGRKEYILSGGRVGNATVAKGLATRVVRRIAYPKSYIEKLGSASSSAELPRLELFLDGYVKTLRWRVYNQTAQAYLVSADIEVATILTAVGQFIATPYVMTPNPWGVRTDYDADQWALDIIFGIVSMGDVYNDPWTFYIDEYRRPHYEPWTPAQDVAL